MCVTVAGLEPDTQYDLVLPRGAAYSAASPGSALRTELRFTFASVLPFTSRFPRVGNFLAEDARRTQFSGLRAALFEVWYPHGFADDSDPEALRAALTLQEVPSPFGGPAEPQDVPFTVSFQTDPECARSLLPMPLWSSGFSHLARCMARGDRLGEASSLGRPTPLQEASLSTGLG